MTQNQRAPRVDEVEILPAIGVNEMLALAALNKEGCAPHSLECAHRRVDATRNNLRGAFV